MTGYLPVGMMSPENLDFIYSPREQSFSETIREYCPPKIHYPEMSMSEEANLKAQAEGNPTLQDKEASREKVERTHKIREWRQVEL